MSEPSGRSPGGVGDGLPALPSGEPILPRWFVISMLLLVPLGVGITIWAFGSTEREVIPVAERRPPGTGRVTHERGDAALNRTREAEPGPGCAAGIELFGDEGARAAGRTALSATCQLLANQDLPEAERGLGRWAEQGGRLRFAVFELTGVDASTRVEEGRLVMELNIRFVFEDAAQAAPFVLHELVHLGRGRWPGQAVTAEGELAAMRVQGRACELLTFASQPPRGCLDAEDLLSADDPREFLREAGFPAG